ncbi:MAG: threonine--tRNA ligase [Candidatus Eisenbacteria bacterium]|uniref:Threonine--tRNA ligase n=1 Tax=Eiseniibacteriota bacterium TaxID=2212470 RepID=A0A948RRR9_UNCEI|nr:threonine--tRNA ligase [Candidatus Eisenbacteria bacterium]MBU1951117.1 threonine--tRNA ligase [Candidatus Eisenbacteria bacterium]MBU2689795.1 threonine--tRNA ligase [Candidatus Eisenbacteria bacterium]
MDVPRGTTALEIAEKISPRLARVAIAALVNGQPKDLSLPLNADVELRILKFDDPEGMDVFRHSSAHLMAHAVSELFPQAQPTIGPVVSEGFYYDFAHEPFTPEDLEKIEKRMKEIVARNLPVERREISREEALEIFKDNPFKVEMIQELPEGEIVSAYQQGDFIDLCRGPHIPHTGMINAFKLTKLAGAYWRADARNPQLQRIYGISFTDPKDLRKHMKLLEEAKKRDHRLIGKQLDLYSFHEEGPGHCFWHPKGTTVYNKMSEWISQECHRRGYQEIRTPLILHESLWHRSGHWDHFRENMYFTEVEGRRHAIKPMNCPGSIIIYNSGLRSYRDLPIRFAELGLVHRHELSGVLHGLFRVRSFTQDDAHIYCTREQMKKEIVDMVRFTREVYAVFGFTELGIYVATRPESALGDPEIWEEAQAALETALKEVDLPYRIKPGEGAFYGPKIEFNIKDCLGRDWQCGTIQVDFSFPQRMDVTYEGSDGNRHHVVLLHRAILGSLERFIGILIEQTAGKLPLWLSPIQAVLIPVADRHQEYATQVKGHLEEAGLRVEVDSRSGSVSKRVREGQLQKIPYILVVGDNEEKDGTVAVRTRDNVVHGPRSIDALLEEALERIRTRVMD